MKISKTSPSPLKLSNYFWLFPKTVSYFSSNKIAVHLFMKLPIYGISDPFLRLHFTRYQLSSEKGFNKMQIFVAHRKIIIFSFSQLKGAKKIKSQRSAIIVDMMYIVGAILIIKNMLRCISRYIKHIFVGLTT